MEGGPITGGRSIPTKAACSAPPARPGSTSSSAVSRPAPRSGGPCRSWGSSGFPPTAPRPRGASRDYSAPCRTAWSRRCAWPGCTRWSRPTASWQQSSCLSGRQRFTVAPRQPHDAHRPLGGTQRLESILSVREPRRVAGDYTVRWQGQRWAIPRAQVRAGLRGARVEVERRLDGSRWVRFRGSYLSLRPCPSPPPAPANPLRPTAYGACGPKERQTKVHSPSRSPLEEDISTLR